MEYKILASKYHHRLAELVNNHIKDDWIPLGSHVITEECRHNRYNNDSRHIETIIDVEYSQTMIKNETKNRH